MPDPRKAPTSHMHEAFIESVNADLGIDQPARPSATPKWLYWDIDRKFTLPAYSSSASLKKCSNSYHREELWARTDDSALNRIVNPFTPFLNRLAQLCKESGIRDCNNKDCVKTRRHMSRIAPSCDWDCFRDWAITAMSCQANFTHDQQQTRAHTHLVTAANICHYLLTKYRDNEEDIEEDLLGLADSGKVEHQHIDLLGVCDVIYWMLTIQARKGVVDTMEAKWGPNFLPHSVIRRSADEALETARKMKICQNRVYALINVAERKEADLPGLMEGVKHFRKGELRHKPHQRKDGTWKGHENCDRKHCRLSNIKSEDVPQLHKAKHEDCDPIMFSAAVLEEGIRNKVGTVWSCDARRILGPKYKYVAISHLWADGTGEGWDVENGRRGKGEVNSCLSEYFVTIVKRIQKKMEKDEGEKNKREWGIWWDTISLPKSKPLKRAALKRMQSDYRNAACMVVHDKYLLNFNWRDDGTPCVAIVLSPWFSRCWTALELHNSIRVKVLFRNPLNPKKPLIMDLDDDILASDPASVTRAHWIASTMIRRLREPVQNAKGIPYIREVKDVNEVLAILQNRMTTRSEDRIRVAAYLANLPTDLFDELDNLKEQSREERMTCAILTHLGKIGHTCLLHGKDMMKESGPYSWCPSNLLDMPFESTGDLETDDEGVSPLTVDENGVVSGDWYYRPLTKADMQGLVPGYKRDPKRSAIKEALENWENCVLLREFWADRGKALLVATLGKVKDPDRYNNWIIDCRYVGPVKDRTNSGFDYGRCEIGTIRIGHARSSRDRNARGLLGIA